jgi:hypothetical protein
VGHLTVTLRTEKLRGQVGKGISVYSNDPKTPSLRLTVRATVLGSVIVLPREYIGIGSRSTRRGTSKVLIRQDPTESGELEISDLKTSLPWLTAEVRKLTAKSPPADGLPPGLPGDYLLEVKVGEKPETQRTRTRAQVSFKTGLKRQPVVSIPVTVDLRPPVILSEESLVLTPPVDGEVTEKIVHVTVRAGLDHNRLKAEAQPKSLKVELKPSGPRRFKAHVYWDGGALEQGSVTFKIGSETLKLPVHSASVGS